MSLVLLLVIPVVPLAVTRLVAAWHHAVEVAPVASQSDVGDGLCVTESRVAVPDGSMFVRHVPPGATLLLACRAPRRGRARFRVEHVGADGRVPPLLDVVHGAAGPTRRWITHEIVLPPSGVCRLAVRYRVVKARRMPIARLMDRMGLSRAEPPAGAAIAEPIVVRPVLGRSRDPRRNLLIVAPPHDVSSRVLARRRAQSVRSAGYLTAAFVGHDMGAALEATPDGFAFVCRVAPTRAASWESVSSWLRRFGARGPWLIYIEERSGEESGGAVSERIVSWLRGRGLGFQTSTVGPTEDGALTAEDLVDE